jgi:hypothetical protein
MPSSWSSSFVFHQYMAITTISIITAYMMVLHSIYTKCSKYADKEKDN